MGTIISSVSQWTNSLLRNDTVTVNVTCNIVICGRAMTVETLSRPELGLTYMMVMIILFHIKG